MGGDLASKAMLWIGCLWPFGLHFGRLAGWSSFCFFLVATLTWAYVSYLAKPDVIRWFLILVAATLLIYSNYYGWMIVACLALDVWFHGRGVQPARFNLLTLPCLALLYLPAWWSFFREADSAGILGGGHPFISATLNAIYNLYSLFVSESIAPWFWWFSIPVFIAIVTSVGLLLALLPKQNLRFVFYFIVLFAGMAVGGIIGTKRLLFISGWLLLPFALAFSVPNRGFLRKALATSLVFIAAIGWLGFIVKKHYAAEHFLEPWPEIADEAALVVKDGGVVVSNGPSFLFYMNYSLERLGLTHSALPGYVNHSRVVAINQWEKGISSYTSSVLFVRAVNKDAVAETLAAEDWFKSHCMQKSARQLVPDSGYPLKSRLFPDAGQMPFRISIQRYACGSPLSNEPR
jgi:hypothetical protein